MENRIYSKMFTWLFVGLLITFISGYCLSLNQILFIKILSIGVIPMIIIELAIAFLMGFFIKKLSPLVTKICYILYSLITGITFATIFITYEVSSVILVFATTALLFAGLALYGHTTKRDVFKLGPMLFFGLIGVMIISIINIFIGSSQLELGLSIISLIIFMGYVIFDMHNIRYLVNSLDEDKAAVYGAFQLYLDFINIFIRLLELLGKRDD